MTDAIYLRVKTSGGPRALEQGYRSTSPPR
jgi:hypothetical protein